MNKAEYEIEHFGFSLEQASLESRLQEIHNIQYMSFRFVVCRKDFCQKNSRQ